MYERDVIPPMPKDVGVTEVSPGPMIQAAPAPAPPVTDQRPHDFGRAVMKGRQSDVQAPIRTVKRWSTRRL